MDFFLGIIHFVICKKLVLLASYLSEILFILLIYFELFSIIVKLSLVKRILDVDAYIS